MAFIDDDEDEDFVPQLASNYYFEDDDKIPVSFASLPIQWSEKEKVDGSAAGLYLRGTAENGLLPLHKLAKAWRFDLGNYEPEISVLTKENIWIKLEKPRKSFEGLIRTVLTTLHFLQFFWRNPQASDKSLWEHLSKTLRSYDVKPSLNDLVDHMDLVSEAVKRHPKLAKSKFMLAFLARKPTKKRLPDEEIPMDDFIVEDDPIVASDEEELDDEDDDFFESVCAICDNGGELLCCEGSCLRSFHATKKDGEDSLCDSLGLNKTQVEAIQKYYCPNCEQKRHLCFICKKLGSSDNSAGAAEVFQCVSATCGYFYHPRCVTRRLRLGNEEEAKALERQITAGEFTCPLHKCSVCGNGEVKTDSNLQFAVCRRCPKSYHRKCLPREISFENIEDEDIFTRAWDSLLHNRVLIYCHEHEIDEELLTPVRDHVKFPFTEDRKKILESHVGRDKERHRVKDLALQDICRKASVKSVRSSFPSSKDGVSTKKHGSSSVPDKHGSSSVPDNMKKRKEVDPYRKSNPAPQKYQKFEESREACRNKVGMKEARKADKSKASLGERSFNYMREPHIVKPGRVVPADSKHNKSDSIVSKEPGSENFTLDSNSQRRLLSIMKQAKEEITMESILKKYKVPSTHKSSSRNNVDKTITMGKVEGSVQAVRTALKKLEEGGSIADAKAICEPEVLSQIFKWKDKLKVYLAPFLHGPRYTSFGRHFTNKDKLQKIVDRLHWYADNGDMIVDFCCGANDFSCLMKAKLEETGKTCSYRNYDIIQPKNDFNFEKKDWLTIKKEELVTGSRLIMGLNPPFGVNASLANMFINKAMEFRPKILILIVPPEAQRLDKKKSSSYVLIWEDDTLLSGRSFYLPGSVNDVDKQLQDWNIISPPLSLWSRPDFAAKHKAIAEKHYHLSRDGGTPKLKKIDEEANTSLPARGASDARYDDNSMASSSHFVKEDVPMEIDEDEVGECVNNILLSEKIQARETVACGNHKSRRSEVEKTKDYSGSVAWKRNDTEEDSRVTRNHQSDHLSRRSQVEKDEKTKNQSGNKVVGKPVGSENVAWKRKNMEENLGGLNRGRAETKIPSPGGSDDIYAVCTPISNIAAPRSHESVEASLPVIITRTRSNLGKDAREKSIGKPEETWNRQRPSSSREDIYTVGPSSDITGQKADEAFEPSFYGGGLSHFDDDLAARYASYPLPDPDQFPLARPNEMFDYRTYSDLASSRIDSRESLQYGGGQLDPMLAPLPPNLMNSSSFPMQQQYAPRFDEMSYQRMNSFPPQQPMQPSGRIYDSRGFPLQPPPPPPPGDFGGFAPGHNYHSYIGRSGGWLND